MRVFVHLVRGICTVWWVFPRLTSVQRDARVQRWAQDMLVRLAIGLRVRGAVPGQGPLLLVSNHISWLDIVVMHAVLPCCFISKSDIRAWPLIGVLANAAGTLYIERTSRRDAFRVVHDMAAALQAGQVLAVFPEGTTGDGQTLLPFHANLLQAAIAASAPAQPVALQFVDDITGQISLAPCYVGDDTLWQSLWRTLCASNVQATVHFGEQQYACGRDRRAWAHDLRSSVIALRD